MLVSIRLYKHSDYYSSHRLMQDPDIHPSAKAVFSMCVSDDDLTALGYAREQCNMNVAVREEALQNCRVGVYSSMFCIIASADVLRRSIRSHYPVSGEHSVRFSTVFNACINPVSQPDAIRYPTIHILWSLEKGVDVKKNHFVPLFVVKGTDYSKDTSMRRSTQTNLSKSFKTHLESSRISTKKG